MAESTMTLLKIERGGGEALHVELREYNGKRFVRLVVYRKDGSPTYTTIRQSELIEAARALVTASETLGGGKDAQCKIAPLKRNATDY
jgi:hypothetical protein